MNKTLVWAGMVLAAAITMGCSGASDIPDDETTAASESELSPSCDMVKCALPMCEQGQHLSYQGSCCATCAGPEPKCAAVMCAMVKCAEDEIAVTPNGQCCPRCHKASQVAECNTDMDCPVYYCFACPCPVSECVGHKCQATTPDSSTCGPLPTL